MSQLGKNSVLTSTEISIVVKMAVRDTLEELGLDLSTPGARSNARADFAYMRNHRVGSEKIIELAKRSAVLAFVGGILWAVWEGVKLALTAKVIS